VPNAHFAHDCYIDKNFISPRGVSAREHTLEFARSAPQPAEEQVQPPAGVRLWQGQTEQEAAGCAPHGGHVTDGSGEALPPDGIRGMLLPQEVRLFQEPVASEDRFIPRLWLEKRRVIANSQRDRWRGRLALGRSGTVRNPSEDCIFVLRLARHELWEDSNLHAVTV
jgi:hypothetical protein